MNFVQYFVTICKVKARADFDRNWYLTVKCRAVCIDLLWRKHKDLLYCRVPGSNSLIDTRLYAWIPAIKEKITYISEKKVYQRLIETKKIICPFFEIASTFLIFD